MKLQTYGNIKLVLEFFRNHHPQMKFDTETPYIVKSGWYTSHWNPFLLHKLLPRIEPGPLVFCFDAFLSKITLHRL